MHSIGMYPKLIIDAQKLRHNAKTMNELCQQHGIDLTGVIKGFNGIPEIAEEYINGGVQSIGSSRLPQLEAVKERHPEIHTLMLRIPMLSELERMLQSSDCSLQSERIVIEELAALCKQTGQTHEVLLMADLGDLREGFFDEQELIQAALYIENEAENLVLKGIGTNLGCYGSITPDQINLGKLVELAEEIESKIGRKLEWVSGGASTTVPLVLNGSIPEGITHLRVGDSIMLRDMEKFFNYTFDGMHPDCFRLEAEIIELKEKPSYPIGTISVDAFGNVAEYENIGTRLKALLAVGRQDVGDMTKLISDIDHIKVIGGSSDHTIVDLTDAGQDFKIGDTLTFTMEYENVLYLSSSEYVSKEIIHQEALI